MMIGRRGNASRTWFTISEGVNMMWQKCLITHSCLATSLRAHDHAGIAFAPRDCAVEEIIQALERVLLRPATIIRLCRWRTAQSTKYDRALACDIYLGLRAWCASGRTRRGARGHVRAGGGTRRRWPTLGPELAPPNRCTWATPRLFRASHNPVLTYALSQTRALDQHVWGRLRHAP